MKRLFKRLGICMLMMTLVAGGASGLWMPLGTANLAKAAPQTIYNQDGNGFSGTIEGNEVSSTTMTGYSDWPDGFNKTTSASFNSGVYDGTNVWMIPNNADRVIRVNAKTGAMTGYNNWPSGFTKSFSAFAGGVYDGANVWMIPQSADRVVKINTTTGVMTGYNSWPSGFTKGSSPFAGSVYDGTNIWMIPYNADRVVKINATTGAMTGYKSWPSGFTKGNSAFVGSVFDGTNIWMIPYSADRVVKINTTTGVMTGYNSWPSGFAKSASAFAGGVYDGTNIWMIPYSADRLIKVNTATGVMTGYNSWPSGFTKGSAAFWGGGYDGTNLWMAPLGADRVMKVNATTGQMTGYKNWPSGFNKTPSSFWGGVYDGSSMWMIPNAADRFVRIGPSADLKSMMLSGATLSPLFDPGTMSYTASVDNGTSSVDVTAVLADKTDTLTVNNAAATSETAVNVPLDVGSNTITIVVTAGDEQTRTYTVTVTRALPSKVNVVNVAGTATVAYTGTAIDLASLSTLFTVDTNAGTRTYTVEPGSIGEGTISGNILTVEKAGPIQIGLATAETQTHHAGTKLTATLIINKGEQNAPSGLSKTAVTTHGGSDGALTGLIAGFNYEYKQEGSSGYTPVTANPFGKITGLAAGSYVVRLAATGLYNAGADSAAVIVGQPEVTPAAAIDYRAEQLTSLTAGAEYTVNGEAVTADTDGKLGIPGSWLGTTLSIVKQGNETTTEDSAAQLLDVPARGAAPSNVGKTDETSLHAANGTLTGLSAGMEYRQGSEGSWSEVTGSSVNGLAPDTYQVRTKATETVFASAAQSVTVNAYTLVKELTPEAGIDYRAEQLTGLTAGAEYTVNGEAVTADTDGKLDITGSWLGTTLSIVKQGNETTTEDSAAQLLDVPARGAAPSNVSKTDETALHAANGTLIGLNAGMEYKQGSEGAWLEVTGSSVIGLAPDTYQVRTKATETAFASAIQSVTVNAYTLVKELTPEAGIDYGAEQLTGLTAGAEYTVNGEAVRADIDGKLDIPGSWLGTMLSIIKQGNETTTEDSAAQLLDVPARGAAPSNVGKTDETVLHAANGTLIGLSTGMEYRQGSEGAWKTVEGTVITGLAPGTYQVRTKATATAFASAAQSVTVNAYTLVKELTPEAGIDYGAEQLTGLTAGAEYTVNGEAVTADDGELDITGSWLGTTLSIVKPGNGTTTEDSAAQTLDVPARGIAPNNVGKTDETALHAANGTLTGLSAGMEYKKGAAGAWSEVTGSSVTGLAPDTYYVRIKATETAFASAAQSLTVNAYTLVKEITPEAGIDYSAEQLTGLTAGTGYTVNGEAVTADNAGKLAIFSSWLGTTLSVVKPGNGTTTEDSEAQTLDVPARGTAPSSVGKTDETALHAANGTLTGLSTGMEYKKGAAGAWSEVTGSSVTGLAPDTYYVRLKATATTFPSAEQSVTVNAYTLVKEITPEAGIDYSAEQLTGLTAGAGYTVNGETATADGDGKLAIDSSWLGTTLSIMKPGNGTTMEDSAAQTLDVPARGTAPNSVGKTDETALHAANGTLTGLSAGMEYKKGAAGAWLDVSGSEVTGLAPDTYYVRLKATATTFASAEQSITVNAYTLVKENTPTAGIDYSAEQLTGLTAGAGYTVNGEAVTADGGGKLAIDSSWLGTTLSIVKPGNGTTTEDSAAQTLDVPARGTAPSSVGKTDETSLHDANGTLTGLSTGMEYKKGAAGAWSEVTGSSVTGLAPDTYYVRVKATATTFASAEQSVTVNAYTLVKEITPEAGIDYSAEQLTGLTAGAGYTVNGEAVTADNDGKLAIDSSWLGTTLSVVKPGNGTTTEDSAAQTLDVPARAAAPVGVTVTDATYRDANNGALQNVTLNMEYRQGSEGAWLDVTGGSVTGLAPDTYYVRIKATETAFASAAQSVTVNAYTLVKELTPAAGIDYRAEQLTGLTAGVGYTVNREAVTPDGEGKLTIDSSWLGTMLSIVKQGNGTTTEDSTAQTLNVPARAAAPVGVTVTDATYRDANNGALQNVTLNMEYRQGSEGAWRIVEGTVITGLAPDIYEVRTKATETTFASNALQVRVHDSDAVIPSAPEVLADDQNNVILGLNTSMEFSVDGGLYTRYDGTNQPELNGEHTVEVRVAASGAVPAGPATTLVFTKNPVTPTNPETPTTPDNTDGNSTGVPPAVKSDNEVIVLVNGKQENAGTANTVMNGNIQTMTIAVNPAKLQAKLDAEGRGAVVTIPVTADVDVIVSELNGQMVQNMERAAATIVLQTGKASYTLPAAEINIQNVAANFGAGVKLEDIKLKITISETPEDMQRVIALAAVKNGFTPVVPALDFRITGTYENKTYEVSQFDVYVERTIPLHNDMDPNRITTGIVVEADGTVRHVPTKVILKDGTYYVVINSLTNSTYSVVWNPLTFADVEQHWAKAAVNDMGSRMVINGVSPATFNPNAEITRAEFAAIMVRGLGLKLGKGQNTFTDIATEAWYAGAVATAAEYGLITGFIDGSFRPDEAITREQAMHIINRAMKLTGLAEQIGAINTADVLGGFQDAGSIDDWAKESLALAVRAGLVSGRSDHKLEAKSYVTRAEVAILIQRLLQQSNLINK